MNIEKMTEEIKIKDQQIAKLKWTLEEMQKNVEEMQDLKGDLEKMQKKAEEMQEIQEAIGGECAIYRKGLEKEHEKRTRQMKLIDKIYIEAKRGKRKELEPEEVCNEIMQIIEKEGDDSEETERNKQ